MSILPWDSFACVQVDFLDSLSRSCMSGKNIEDIRKGEMSAERLDGILFISL